MPSIHGCGSMPAISIGTPDSSTVADVSRSSRTGASSQSSRIIPRENGSRVRPMSWLPNDA